MGSVFDDPPNLKSWYLYSIIIFQPKMPHHIHVTRLGAWWWCIWSLWGIQNRVISTPNGWSLTRLPNLSRTHVLITAEVENDIKLYSWLCRSHCKNSFQERALPYLQGCHEGFSRLASSTDFDGNLEISSLMQRLWAQIRSSSIQHADRYRRHVTRTCFLFPWSETQLDCSALSMSGTVIGQPNG